MTVHLSEVDRPFEPVHEGVERSGEVVRRHTEIPGEMVARSGGDADKRKPVCTSGRRHYRYRSIAARHPEDVDAVGDRLFDESSEVLAPG